MRSVVEMTAPVFASIAWLVRNAMAACLVPPALTAFIPLIKTVVLVVALSSLLAVIVKESAPFRRRRKIVSYARCPSLPYASCIFMTSLHYAMSQHHRILGNRMTIVEMEWTREWENDVQAYM
jgi:hypothetical protein